MARCRDTYIHILLTDIFEENMGKPAAISVALTRRWGCHKVLQPLPHPLISSTMAKGFWCKAFTGQTPFLHPTDSVKAARCRECLANSHLLKKMTGFFLLRCRSCDIIEKIVHSSEKYLAKSSHFGNHKL